MVNWEPITDTEAYKDFEGFFDMVQETRGFEPPKPGGKTDEEVYAGLPDEMQKYIDESMEYYQELFKGRIQPPPSES